MVVRTVDPCLGVIEEVGRVVGRFGSKDWAKRWVFDQIRQDTAV